MLRLRGVSGTLAPLAGMTGLVEVRLGNGLIEDVSVLSGVRGLAKVSLPHNRIVDLAPLVSNAGLRPPRPGRRALQSLERTVGQRACAGAGGPECRGELSSHARRLRRVRRAMAARTTGDWAPTVW